MLSSGNLVQELVVGWDSLEEAAGGGAALGRCEARLLGEEHNVARHALRVKKPCLGANAVEAGALGVACRRMVAQGRLLVPPARGQDEEEVVLEEEHVVRARLEGLEGGPAGPRPGGAARGGAG